VKILYLITKSNWGGAQRHLFDLAVHSKTLGHDVTVALGGEGMLRERLGVESIPTRTIDALKRDVDITHDSASFMNIMKIVREIRPDVLHLHSPKAAGLGAMAGRVWGIKKIVYTVHGWTFNEDRPIHEKAMIIFISWLTTLLCTDIITLSDREMRQAQMFPGIKNKLHMIHLGITAPKFFATNSAKHLLQAKITEPMDKKVIVGTIAELHKNKGLIYAINAFEKISHKSPSAIFVVIGEGEERENLEKLISEKSLHNKVFLIGYVENAAEYLKAFSIFLLPSIKEGLPYCLIEAGYAGLPVIATTVGGISEIIDDMKSGILIQPKRADEISHAVEFLIEHRGIQKAYANTLQEKVRNVFNLDAMLTRTMKLYESDIKPL
jgi:glycosyltransferase involved in cell wall biosynthesis